MTTEPHREATCPDKPARPFPQRMGRWMDLLKFACARGGSLPDTVRLFYHLAIRPSLVFHGWGSYSPGRIVSFGFKASGHTRFRVYARDNGLDPGTLTEFFSPHSRLVPAELPPMQPQVVYDLGANIGIASLRFATLYPAAQFYGFEPVPANHEVCVLNYHNLRRAQAFPWAVGSRSEVTAFECNEDPRGGHLQATPANPQLQPKKRIEVQVYSMADLIRAQKLEPPEFLKIDVEGAEVEVLKGMGEAVTSVRRMFVETHGAALKEECLQWMREHGFKIWPSPDPTAIWGDRV